ncbi:MAG TPA: HisA/HisF-related TIM barrel protein [Gemmatimonadales bacterium]|jgi:phosphoribosylformimino-5-aminoimidazole carboxamide ribotide isomerase|nr:HisA/HisF-related TIM barrel protein [Gemmatimonadales bacterium]
MEIIPVIDIVRGVAVHAQGGDRSAYPPVKSAVAPDHPGDAVALVRAYRDVLGAVACYVADLDALQGGPVQRGLIRELAAFQTGFSGELLVDAAASGPDGALEVLSCGASDAIIGMETLRSFADLKAIVAVAGSNRVIFGLDLRLGAPIINPLLDDAAGAHPDPMALTGQAVDAGVTSILVLDLARIGSGCGVDLGLVDALRRRYPHLRLLAGGGVLTRKDLERMEDAGCDGALVASAIHAGRIGANDVAALRHGRPAAGQSPASASR